ncbi:MAG: phosphatidylserine decarboxylase [Rickettsiales bacterium]|nr:phosphatidylserine decarboxylase [Rickettsiales bacterium]
MNDFIQGIIVFLRFPIHPAGWIFIALFAIGALLLALISSTLGIIGLALTIWCIFFFRDPKRVTPLKPGLIISPADGLISRITKVIPPFELGLGDEERWRISVFLSVFNVHVNRIPIVGNIVKLHYHEGLFLNATLDKASEDNERQMIAMKTDDGHLLGIVQIAGLIARRIICDLSEGQRVEAGERFGIIRFGSRVDVYLPVGIHPLVMEGQTAIGGETIFADLVSTEESRTGVSH